MYLIWIFWKKMQTMSPVQHAGLHRHCGKNKTKQKTLKMCGVFTRSLICSVKWVGVLLNNWSGVSIVLTLTTSPPPKKNQCNLTQTQRSYLPKLVFIKSVGLGNLCGVVDITQQSLMKGHLRQQTPTWLKS